MKLTAHKQVGFGNRMHTVDETEVFNAQIIRKGLKTDGGSIPKIFIISTFLLLSNIYDFHWVTSFIIFAVAIDESNGWFQRPFYLHDQDWQDANCWADLWRANWMLFKNILYQVSLYENRYFIKYFFHVPLGILLAVVYSIGVATAGLTVAYFKYARLFNKKSQ